MTHSTLTWFSRYYAPMETGDQFLLSTSKGVVFINLYMYSKDEDVFVQCADNERKIARGDVGYWAYVPFVVDVMQEGKQSQVPNE